MPFKKFRLLRIDSNFGYLLPIFFLITCSVLILNSIAKYLFPTYFLYIIASIFLFITFSQIDFDILTIFYIHFYIFSIILLATTLIIGQVTRGAIRWIPIGPFTVQTTEIVRPFLLIFFAKFITEKEMNLKRFLFGILLISIPFILIWFQPSLGVAILTLIGFIGCVLSSGINKKIIIAVVLLSIVALPLIWTLLAPYQKVRITSLLSGAKDSTGASYNSIESMISVGSGGLNGRGLGQGIQTQLAFLPERHTDFIFASIAEEMGFIGASLVLITFFFILYRIIIISETAQTHAARTFAIGVFLTLFVQVSVHTGMNMGLLPITGLPFPLVSAGGSSLIATMTTLGILMGIKRRDFMIKY
jgi:rod shape determining protein RodA